MYFFSISKNLHPLNTSPISIAKESENIDIDEALKVRECELKNTNKALIKTKQKYSKILLNFNLF